MREGVLEPSGDIDQTLGSSSEVFDGQKIIERLIGEIQAAEEEVTRVRVCKQVLGVWEIAVRRHPELKAANLLHEIDKKFSTLLKEVLNGNN